MHKIFSELTTDEKLIRDEVFGDEQGFQEEYDEIDNRAQHVVIYEEDIPIATCRFYLSDEADGYAIGRIAVRKEHRGKHLGNQLMAIAEDEIKKLGGKTVSLSAQVQAQGFYEKCGYKAVGNVYLDENCEHVRMLKDL